jgi:hypothetical protein
MIQTYFTYMCVYYTVYYMIYCTAVHYNYICTREQRNIVTVHNMLITSVFFNTGIKFICFIHFLCCIHFSIELLYRPFSIKQSIWGWKILKIWCCHCVIFYRWSKSFRVFCKFVRNILNKKLWYNRMAFISAMTLYYFGNVDFRSNNVTNWLHINNKCL